MHGVIDGFSRLITSLFCATDNRAYTVLKGFIIACHRYGIPSRYRTDRGWENGKSALFINLVRGHDRGSHIAGKSVHNQRIERLWRDVRKEVLQPLRDTFYNLEDSDTLDPGNATHLAALHLVWLPIINEQLEEFRRAWNKHSIRTTSGVIVPEKAWMTGFLDTAYSGHTAPSTIFGQQPPSVEQSLREALAKFDIPLEALGPENPEAEDRVDLVTAPQIPI